MKGDSTRCVALLSRAVTRRARVDATRSCRYGCMAACMAAIARRLLPVTVAEELFEFCGEHVSGERNASGVGQ